MELYFKCFDKEFKDIDFFFAEQQYTSKPNFKSIVLETESTKYYYEVQYIHGYYYIVTK